MDILTSPFRAIDEFICFNTTLQSLFEKDEAFMQTLVAQLNDN